MALRLSFNSLWVDRKRGKFAQGRDSQHWSLPRHKKSALGWLLKLIFTFGSPRALTPKVINLIHLPPPGPTAKRHLRQTYSSNILFCVLIAFLFRAKEHIYIRTKMNEGGFSSWHGGLEYACQSRGHGFDTCHGKIPHAAEPAATTTETCCLEPVLRT